MFFSYCHRGSSLWSDRFQVWSKLISCFPRMDYIWSKLRIKSVCLSSNLHHASQLVRCFFELLHENNFGVYKRSNSKRNANNSVADGQLDAPAISVVSLANLRRANHRHVSRNSNLAWLADSDCHDDDCFRICSNTDIPTCD